MNIEVVKSKIHRVKITGSDLNYIGSITLDEDLMDAANIIEGERVYIVNVNNGERLSTYVIKGVRKSGDGRDEFSKYYPCYRSLHRFISFKKRC